MINLSVVLKGQNLGREVANKTNITFQQISNVKSSQCPSFIFCESKLEIEYFKKLVNFVND